MHGSNARTSFDPTDGTSTLQPDVLYVFIVMRISVINHAGPPKGMRAWDALEVDILRKVSEPRKAAWPRHRYAFPWFSLNVDHEPKPLCLTR